MRKISNNVFRNIIANTVIIVVLLLVFSFSYMGGTMNVFSQNQSSAIYHGNNNNKKVSLMINVYWGTEYLDKMLNVLKDNNVKTTFFVGGMWVEDNENMLKKIYSEGHEIANHGYFHKDHDKISKERNIEEIKINHNLVKKMINYDMTLFAPPSGAYNNTTLEVAKGLGYKTIMWTKDTIDWRDKDEHIVYTRAVKNPNAGDLILMHPTKATSNVLDKIIKFYLNEGFKVTTVSDNLL